MNRKTLFVPACLAAASLAAVVASIAIAQPAKDAKHGAGAPPEMKLPKGWTPEDMQACMMAGMPGEMHQRLAKSVGAWRGKQQMWMGLDSDAMTSECTSTVTSLMDGRYTKVEVAGDMPGMGPFSGMGVSGYDNVSKKFVSTWIDNMSTGIMTGTGEMSADGKTITYTFTYNCPINKKPAAMRQVETMTSDTTMTMEMFGSDPKSGKEYKMISIQYAKAK